MHKEGGPGGANQLIRAWWKQVGAKAGSVKQEKICIKDYKIKQEIATQNKKDKRLLLMLFTLKMRIIL